VQKKAEQELGKVTIAPNVLVTIVHKTAETVPGVARLSENVPGVKRLLGLPTVGHGVELDIVDDQVTVDVYLVAKRNVELLAMGRQLQQEITRAIEDIVGKQVHEVNIHVDDVETELSKEIVGTSTLG
jgi:uncharacterized alkaline shock family protein YloU